MIFQLFATALLVGATVIVFIRSFSFFALKAGLIAIFTLATYFVWRPDDLTRFANVVGIGRGADLVGYVSTLALLLVILGNAAQARRSERQLTLLCRHLAIRDAQAPGGTSTGRSK